MSAIGWHLIAPSGRVARSCTAPDKHVARALLDAPEGWLVVSAASWAVSAQVRIPEPQVTWRELCRALDPDEARKAVRREYQQRWRENLDAEGQRRLRARQEVYNARRRQAS